jgi:hypothetical protein
MRSACHCLGASTCERRRGSDSASSSYEAPGRVGLITKRVIEVLLAVGDASDQPAYVQSLEAAGYRLQRHHGRRICNSHQHEPQPVMSGSALSGR